MGRRIVVLVGAVAAFALTVGVVGGAAFTGTPSGERMFNSNSLEPFYNAEKAGQIGIMLTPKNGAPTKANSRSWSPIYLPVYPVGSTAASTYLCRHLLNGQVSDNCPSHGPAIAGLAASAMPTVYGAGVAGHDHVMDAPGGADFNVAWEPIVVLFTSSAAANEHLVTDAQIEAAVDRGDAIEIPLPQLTFHCSVVSNRVWDRGTDVPPFTG